MIATEAETITKNSTMMKYESPPRLPKWPFFVADVLLLTAAALIVKHAQVASPWWMFLLVVAVGFAAWVGVTPFLVQHRSDVRFGESNCLVNAVEQLENLRSFTNQISFATAQWRLMQEQAESTVATARQLSERMAAEAKAFGEFMQKNNETERGHLRLQVEKMQRGQQESLQVLVSLMDHVYALYLGGCRSGQANVIEQLGRFQNACREVTRKVGLVAFEVPENTAFDPNMHQLLNGDTPAAEARIGSMLAPGYSFQGQVIRNALVALKGAEAVATTAPKLAPVAQ